MHVKRYLFAPHARYCRKVQEIIGAVEEVAHFARFQLILVQSSCMSYEEEDTCMSHEGRIHTWYKAVACHMRRRIHACHTYEEEDTRMSYIHTWYKAAARTGGAYRRPSMSCL